MKFCLLFLLFFLFHLNLSLSQSNDELINNTDIIWIAEFYTDISPDTYAYLYRKEGDSTIGTHKCSWVQLNTKEQALPGITENYGSNLSYRIIQKTEAYNKSPELFTGSDLSETLTESAWQENFYIVDTVTTFDPETFEQNVKVLVSNKLCTPETELVFRFYHYLYFSKSSNSFILKPKAVSVMAPHYDDNGFFIHWGSLFYWPVNKLFAEEEIYNEKNQWTKFIQRSVFIDSFKVLKSEMSFDQILLHLITMAKSGSAEVFNNIRLEKALDIDNVNKVTSYIQTVEEEGNGGFTYNLKEITQPFTGREVSELILNFYMLWNGEEISVIPHSCTLLQDQSDEPFGRKDNKQKIVPLHLKIK